VELAFRSEQVLVGNQCATGIVDVDVKNTLTPSEALQLIAQRTVVVPDYCVVPIQVDSIGLFDLVLITVVCSRNSCCVNHKVGVVKPIVVLIESWSERIPSISMPLFEERIAY
jgi:hypothetical protein